MKNLIFIFTFLILIISLPLQSEWWLPENFYRKKPFEEGMMFCKIKKAASILFSNFRVYYRPLVAKGLCQFFYGKTKVSIVQKEGDIYTFQFIYAEETLFFGKKLYYTDFKLYRNPLQRW